MIDSPEKSILLSIAHCSQLSQMYSGPSSNLSTSPFDLVTLTLDD
jgi:hypothetical protein